MASPFYITTPIYYPNGEPHLGHTYTTVCADVIARYHRLRADDTFFLTGTDEHGIKMVKTAESAGTTPLKLADQNVAVFENWWKEISISHIARLNRDLIKAQLTAAEEKHVSESA